MKWTEVDDQSVDKRSIISSWITSSPPGKTVQGRYLTGREERQRPLACGAPGSRNVMTAPKEVRRMSADAGLAMSVMLDNLLLSHELSP